MDFNMLYLELLILSIVNTASSDTFHIVTSPAAPCPGEFFGEPCLTLQQYVSNPSISNGNITLLFETGNHTLSSTFSASNAMKLIISGNNSFIQCTSSEARLTFTSIQYLNIRGLTFIRCGSLSTSRGTNTIWSHITFSQCGHVSTSHGTSTVWSYLTFSRCVPISVSAVQQLNIDNCTFQYVTGNSAALILSGINTANITQCNFCNNRNRQYRGRGGALYLACQLVNLSNTLFLSNSASDYQATGGAIYNSGSTLILDNCNFTSNSASEYAGAVYTHGPHLEIYDSTFTRNTAVREGGAVISHSIRNSIRNTSFKINSGGQGGAYYGTTTANCHQCVFVQNTAQNGGGIYISSSFSSLNISNTVFHINVATSNGGSIYAATSSHGFIRVTRSQFMNNFVRKYGGSIYSSGPNLSLHISNSSYINNTALTLGGGAMYSNSRYSNITITSSIFSYNSASYCSVLDVDEYYHFNVNLTDSVFTHNTATGQLIGGGVACIRNASINIIRSTFKHNYADLHGGVFYIDESDTSVVKSLFTNNSAAVDGGVFYTYVHASNYNIRRSHFSLNSARDDGGVLYIGRVNSRVNIDESIFSWNDASDRGGVIAIIASSMYMEINRTNLFNNTALYGGIISACNSEVTVLEEELFVSTDPVYSFCTLYDGDVTHFNITAPQDLEVTTTSTLELLLSPSVTEQTLPSTSKETPSMSSTKPSLLTFSGKIQFSTTTFLVGITDMANSISKNYQGNSLPLSILETSIILTSDKHETYTVASSEYITNSIQSTTNLVLTTLENSASPSTALRGIPLETSVELIIAETSPSGTSSISDILIATTPMEVPVTTFETFSDSELSPLKLNMSTSELNTLSIVPTSQMTSTSIKVPYTMINDIKITTVGIIPNVNSVLLQLNIVTGLAILLSIIMIVVLLWLIIQCKIQSGSYFYRSKPYDRPKMSIYKVKNFDLKDGKCIDHCMYDDDAKEKDDIVI